MEGGAWAAGFCDGDGTKVAADAVAVDWRKLRREIGVMG